MEFDCSFVDSVGWPTRGSGEREAKETTDGETDKVDTILRADPPIDSTVGNGIN